MQKKLLAIGFGVALSVTTASAMAMQANALMLINNSPTLFISVNCNGKMGIPIVKGLPLVVSYSQLISLFHPAPTGMLCTFSNNGAPVGSAMLLVKNGSQAAIMSDSVASGYSVTLTKSNGGQIYAPTGLHNAMTVSIQ